MAASNCQSVRKRLSPPVVQIKSMASETRPAVARKWSGLDKGAVRYWTNLRLEIQEAPHRKFNEISNVL